VTFTATGYGTPDPTAAPVQPGPTIISWIRGTFSGGGADTGCFSQAWRKDGNGASLLLDVAGIGASLIPGGGIVKGSLQTLALGAQTSVALAGVVNSAAHRQTDMALVGIFGSQIAPLAESGLKYAEAVPYVGLLLNGLSTAVDVGNTYRAFRSCQVGTK